MAPKKTAAGAAAGADDACADTQVAQALSTLLKKSHAARTQALFKKDCPVSRHVLGEAQRAALDPNMMHSVYMGVLCQELNPCAPG